ncbi:hypothetical protein [Bradyrhizobium japonicum]|uniref:hypothetical protein n=1 Tax=Bradyrhizobium japonicum TaxID=375 RepID=UPI00200F9B87|nr:hypothetical protein [Bradyrhizobium japonicum]WLB21026.1 hypothetical protein QIH95_09125 [Bradyrhizobium japonicum]
MTEIEDALASPLPSKGQELVERADLLVEEEFKAMAAEERRRAVLEGLAGLGYEVFEGMATAWVQNGQIVIRKAANPGYGVELLGGPRSDLLQVRAVVSAARPKLAMQVVTTTWKRSGAASSIA